MNQKILSLGFNVLLTLAVIGLYVIHFTSNHQPHKDISAKQAGDTTSLPVTAIAYINIDTLLEDYAYYHELRQSFERSQQKLEGQLQGKAEELQKKQGEFFEKAQKGLLTRTEQKDAETQLRAEEAELMKLREQLSMQLAEEEQVMQRKLVHDISEYLKSFNQQAGYQFIVSAGTGSNLLYTADSLNITAPVLKGLNEQYNQAKKKK